MIYINIYIKIGVGGICWKNNWNNWNWNAFFSSKRFIIRWLTKSSIFRITWKRNVSSQKERFWGLYLFHFSSFCAFFWDNHAFLYGWEWIWSNKEIRNSGWNKTVSWGKWKLSGTESPFFLWIFSPLIPHFPHSLFLIRKW